MRAERGLQLVCICVETSISLRLLCCMRTVHGCVYIYVCIYVFGGIWIECYLRCAFCSPLHDRILNLLVINAAFCICVATSVCVYVRRSSRSGKEERRAVSPAGRDAQLWGTICGLSKDGHGTKWSDVVLLRHGWDVWVVVWGIWNRAFGGLKGCVCVCLACRVASVGRR